MLKLLKTVAATGLSALFLLAGCGSDESRSIIMAAPPSSQAAGALSGVEDAALQDEPIALTTMAHTLQNTYAGTAAGCYNLSTYTDGSADLFWFDYENLSMSLLDYPNNITSPQSGHVPDCYGGVVPIVSGESLFLFRLGGDAALEESYGEAGRAAIMHIDPATGKGAIYTFPPLFSFVLESAVLSDGEHFYFLMQDASAGDTATVLVRFSLSALNHEVLHQMLPGYDYSIEGHWEKGPVVRAATPLPPMDDPGFAAAWDARTYTLYNFGLATGNMQQSASWNQGVSTSMQGNLLYYWSDEEDTLYSLNVDSGALEVVASGFAPKNATGTLTRTLLDGKLRMQFATGKITYYAIDTATGEVMATPLENLGENIAVFAETPEYFLMVTGSRWVRRDLIDPTFTFQEGGSYSTNYISMPEYGLIAKQDFWNGTRKFVAIEDLVYT